MFLKIVLIYILFIFDLIFGSIILKSQKLSPEDLLICKFQPNGFSCSDETSSSKFYFDTVLKTCSTFEYGECDLTDNQFNTLDDCNKLCIQSLYQDLSGVLKNLASNLTCRLQPEFGDCHKYYPMFYFDVSTHACKGFSYSGCGGNGNRFATKMACKNSCTDCLSVPSRVQPNS